MSQAFSLTPRGLKTVSVSNTVTVPMASTTQLLELNLLDGVEKVSFQISNITQALDAFVVEGRVHQDATYFIIANAAGDFSAPSGRIFNVNGAPVTLAASASARFDLDVSGLYSVRVSASAAADSAVVTIYASGAAAGAANNNVTLTTGDIEIGAVEIKNGADDTRAKVAAASTLPVATDTALIVTQRDALPAGTNAIGVVAGTGYTSVVSVTRTNDTNAYTGGDVIGTGTGASGAVLEFTSISAGTNAHIIITDADLRIDVTAVPSGMTSFRLHLYTATMGSALGDNAVWDLPSGDRASYLGYIDLGTPVAVGVVVHTLFVQVSGVNKKVKTATSSLFGYLVSNGGYTPAAQVVKSIRLNAIGA